MQPYYQDDAVTLYHGDCRDILPALPTFDLAIVDPPYAETSLAWDRRVPGWPKRVLQHLGPAASLWCFGSLRSLLECADEFQDYHFAQDLIWEKHNGSNFHADRFRRVHEIIAQFYPVTVRWADVYKVPQTTPDAMKRTIGKRDRPRQNGHTGTITPTSYATHDGGPRLMRSVLRVRSCHGYAVHETQKPTGIITPLIDYSCPPDGVILDVFAGVGSVGVAAKQVGRRAVLIELREECCELAAQRLEQQDTSPIERWAFEQAAIL